jgi:hypothetical protein
MEAGIRKEEASPPKKTRGAGRKRESTKCGSSCLNSSYFGSRGSRVENSRPNLAKLWRHPPPFKKQKIQAKMGWNLRP